MTDQRTLEIIQELQKTCLEGFRIESFAGDCEGLFRSHFDWHSSVHAHWMLLSSSRFLKNSNLSEKILARLTSEAIFKETLRLRNAPEFELPYGLAWLILLLKELEEHRQLPEAVTLKTETFERIFTWLSETEFPQKSANSYHSWLITYFLLKKSKIQEFSGQMSSLDQKFESVSEVSDENDPKDFFSSESLFHILKGKSPRPVSLAAEIKNIEKITPANCHAVGKLIS